MALSDVGKKRARVVIWSLGYAVACWVFVLVRDRSLFPAVLATFAVTGTALKLHEVARQKLRDQSFGARMTQVLWVPIFGVVLLVAWLWSEADCWGFFGVAVLYLGLGLVVEQLREEVGFARKGGRLILGICAASLLVGLVSMAFGRSWAVYFVAGGLVPAPVGVSLVSAALNQRLRAGKGPPPLLLAMVGVALMAEGLVFMWKLRVSGWYLLVLGTALFLLVLAMAARSNADVVVIVALAAVVWTLTHRTVPMTDAVKADDGETVMLALGDSYISGEGADQFYKGTNQKGDNECRRAPTAYPALLTLEKRPTVSDDVAFLACSGAKAPEVREQLVELEELRRDTKFEIRFVLLSVGGNDALFGRVGKTCLMAGDCSEIGQGWTDNLAAVRHTLDVLYRDVRKATDAPVLVVPYPIPINHEKITQEGKKCGYSPFSESEHRFLHAFTVALNGVVQQAAADARFHYVYTIPDSLQGRRLCDRPAGEVGVNFLATNSVVGTLEQAVYPLNWFHNSLHPNRRGHELMEAEVVRWLDAHPDLGNVVAAARPGDDPATRTATAAARTGQRCEGRGGPDLNACTDRWMREQNGRFLLTRGLVVLAIALGAWFLAVALIHLWWVVLGGRPDEV